MSYIYCHNFIIMNVFAIVIAMQNHDSIKISQLLSSTTYPYRAGVATYVASYIFMLCMDEMDSLE